MRYNFVISVALITLILITFPHFSRGKEASLTQSLEGCDPHAGAVFVSPDPPHKVIAKFCSSELKRLDCQILAHLRNYIFYSYGRCTKNEMYQQFFRRLDCSQVSERDREAYNNNIDKAIPPEVWEFIRVIINIEAEKGCLADNIISQ
jgi:hypothetical protein